MSDEMSILELGVSLLPHLILSDTALSLWCTAQLARRFLSQSLSHPLGDAGLDPRAAARTRPDWLRTCSVVSCARRALSLRFGPLSLTAPMQVAGPLLQVSVPSPAHASPIRIYTDTNWPQ